MKVCNLEACGPEDDVSRKIVAFLDAGPFAGRHLEILVLYTMMWQSAYISVRFVY